MARDGGPFKRSSHLIRYHYFRAISSDLKEDIDMAKITTNPEKYIFGGALELK